MYATRSEPWINNRSGYAAQRLSKTGLYRGPQQQLEWHGVGQIGHSLACFTCPPLVVADAEQPVALNLQTGTSYWHAGLPTPTWGINGPFLGPALQLQRGQRTAIKVINQLPEATTIHWHGLEIPGDQDGGPHKMIAPGASWTAQLTLDQPAATCWFHPHPHQVTGRHVAMGLAGLLLLEDDESRRLALLNSGVWMTFR